MSDIEYSGWTNYETWCVVLWINNTEGDQRYWQEETQRAWDRAKPGQYTTKEQEACRYLAERLQVDHEAGAAEIKRIQGTVYIDLLGRALDTVNWDEIAKSFLEDVDKTKQLVKGE